MAHRLARHFHFGLAVRRLLQRASDVGEHIVGVRPNQADSADDDHQNHSQHDRIFGNILTTFIIPKILYKVRHGLRLLSANFQRQYCVLRSDHFLSRTVTH
jgi:hypothetical protein